MHAAIMVNSPISWLRRIFRPAPRRWSASAFVNIVSAVFIGWYVVFGWLAVNWHLSVDIQKVQCLPYEYYLVHQGLPEHFERGTIYRYRAVGLGPVISDGTPLGKIAAALPGDTVDVNARGVFINGHLWGPINPLVLKKTGKTLAQITAHYVVPPGKLLMLGTLPRSYDGRYWGLISETQVLGKAWPLW